MANERGEGDFAELLAAVEQRKGMLLDYLLRERVIERFQPAHIREAVTSTILAGGKSLRPAVAMLACGALGGDEARVLPVAAAIEVYHTWTLVHDDIIDRDDTRRGQPSVHRQFAARAAREFGWPPVDADHYGTTIAILAGDLQQAWSWSLLFEAAERGVRAEVILGLARILADEVTPLLVEGETLDVQYAGAALELDQDAVIDALWKKTGALYEFAGRAGAAIALNDSSADQPEAKAIASFCKLCGTAFQIQDDILGVVGDAEQLGKPVGSDIREGKTTLLTLHALARASQSQRDTLLGALGDEAASADDVDAVIQLLRETGAVSHAQVIARRYVEQALRELEALPDNRYRWLLSQWAHYLISRQF